MGAEISQEEKAHVVSPKPAAKEIHLPFHRTNYLKLYDKTPKIGLTHDLVCEKLPENVKQDYKKCKGDVPERCVTIWTGKHYKKINNAIIADDSDELAKYIHLIRGINIWITTHRPEKSLTTYRGSQMSESTQESINVGDVFRHCMFVATSTSKSVAKRFKKKIMLKYEIPAGCYNGAEISSLSQFKGEREVLLPPYTALMVVKKTKYKIKFQVLENLAVEQKEQEIERILSLDGVDKDPIVAIPPDATEEEVKKILIDFIMSDDLEIVRAVVRKWEIMDLKLDDDGNTPIFYAVMAGNLEMVKFLITAGADIGKRNNIDELPRDIARKNNHKEVKSFLYALEKTCYVQIEKKKSPPPRRFCGPIMACRRGPKGLYSKHLEVFDIPLYESAIKSVEETIAGMELSEMSCFNPDYYRKVECLKRYTKKQRSQQLQLAEALKQENALSRNIEEHEIEKQRMLEQLNVLVQKEKFDDCLELHDEMLEHEKTLATEKFKLQQLDQVFYFKYDTSKDRKSNADSSGKEWTMDLRRREKEKEFILNIYLEKCASLYEIDDYEDCWRAYKALREIEEKIAHIQEKLSWNGVKIWPREDCQKKLNDLAAKYKYEPEILKW